LLCLYHSTIAQAAEPVPAELLRPDFLPEQQQVMGSGDERFAVIVTSVSGVVRGHVVLVAGSGDAIRSHNPLQVLSQHLAKHGFASWMLLRDNNDQAQLKNRIEQVLVRAKQHASTAVERRAEITATEANANVLLLLQSDAAQQLDQWLAHNDVQAIVLLSAETSGEPTLTKPVLDCFSRADRSRAYTQFLQRQQRWLGLRLYRALPLTIAQDQRFERNEEWLTRQIIGWWQQHSSVTRR
jgi:hypothetical protein